MKYTSTVVALAMALFVNAAPIPKVARDTGNNGRVDFISTDNLDRTINCACNPGSTCPQGLSVPAGQTVTQMFEENFQGNCWATIAGDVNKGTGMLAEIAFGAWEGKTYFDVSAIVVPDDTKNIYAMTPGDGDSPVSGCMNGIVGGTPGNIACANNIYVLPDDEQTKVTNSNYLKVFMGPPQGGAAASGSSSSAAASVAVSSVAAPSVSVPTPVVAAAATVSSSVAAVSSAANVPTPVTEAPLTTVVAGPIATVTVWITEN